MYLLCFYITGITSDPLTQFACVFSALIHDLDHYGVPNMVLVKEEDPLAVRYKKKSVLEQNSVDLVWDLLMQDRFDSLRSCICSNKTEGSRFRALVVNSVMATDIVRCLVSIYLQRMHVHLLNASTHNPSWFSHYRWTRSLVQPG